MSDKIKKGMEELPVYPSFMEPCLPDYDTDEQNQKARLRYHRCCHRMFRSWRALASMRNTRNLIDDEVIIQAASAYAIQKEEKNWWRWMVTESWKEDRASKRKLEKADTPAKLMERLIAKYGTREEMQARYEEINRWPSQNLGSVDEANTLLRHIKLYDKLVHMDEGYKLAMQHFGAEQE
jgi:hypothetical protein